MAQRCSFCGKTEKQHQGKACLDPSGPTSVAHPYPDDSAPEDSLFDFGWTDPQDDQGYHD